MSPINPSSDTNRYFMRAPPCSARILAAWPMADEAGTFTTRSQVMDIMRVSIEPPGPVAFKEGTRHARDHRACEIERCRAGAAFEASGSHPGRGQLDRPLPALRAHRRSGDGAHAPAV